MSEDNETGMTPVNIGSSDLAAPGAMDDVFGNTTGGPASPMEAITIYNQGKADFWKFGDGEKRDSVFGIFLYSARPMRAFWPGQSMDGSPPECWSVNGQVPHPIVENPQSDACKGCPLDKLGTAHIGRGKACKTKAADFIVEVPEGVDIVDGVAQIEAGRILGPALMRYSISNREGPQEWTGFVRQAKAIGKVPYPQAVLGKWTFQEGRSKSGTDYSAIKMEVVAALPGPEDDPDLWKMIATETQQLKTGAAEEILVILSGSANDGDE